MSLLLFSKPRTVTRRKDRLYLITHELLRQEVERMRKAAKLPWWV